VKNVSWNRRAVEHSKAQGFDDPRHVICRGCGTKPAIRQFGRYQCECGELEGLSVGETALGVLILRSACSHMNFNQSHSLNRFL
jgi:hypothetical protein